MADEAGCPAMSDADEVTCAHYALGEFAVVPQAPLGDELPPAELAGRYEVGRLIGSGGTARVYRAYDLRLDRQVAVKIYDRGAVALDQRRRLREMSIQGSIAHPGVVALHDSGIEHGRTFLVMQLVEGENLAERLLGGPMTADEVTALATGLTEALAHVHALRVVHRDLKPANVFLSADGPLIGDFGIAHALDTTHITGTGVIPGTAAYLAPEQVAGEPAGPAADVYALGLILLECLTGEREYQGTMVEAAMARLARPPRIPDGLPPALTHTLRRMTHREPADRPSAAEVLRLLRTPPSTLPSAAPDARPPRWRRGRATATPATTTAPDVRPPRRRRAMVTATLATAAAATIAAVLLAAPETGTGTTTPAQQPAPGSTAAAAPPPSSSSPQEVAAPAATESADLEPAAVTHRNTAQNAPQPPKTVKQRGKSGKSGPPPGQGKGKGPGSDS
ncbi:serine/threonine-protein kinase [Amycolatopsis sp., V23-08]|uniref:non-specific serine/threonine protein kinase n=1 Tax=Amycolatopsis heterodermiae TaxID=3110235 RepID=A0ABU5R1N4_9PSEU|nr:serine/threonine-protein kinase [Amycolatopsis sp., V23-08]MEA5360112.1 serine/threonine-protein kinase [Amycolatopsis sp., V23-08]